MKLSKVILSWLLLLLLSVPAWARTLQVPQDYPKISEAITAASPGDRIVIAAGKYVENLVIDKDLILEGYPPPPKEFLRFKREPQRKWLLPEERYVDLKPGDTSRPLIVVRGRAQVAFMGFFLHGAPQALVITDQARATFISGLILDQTLNAATVNDGGVLELRYSQVLLNFGEAALIARDTAQLALQHSVVSVNLGGGILLRDQAQAELDSSEVSDNLGTAISVRDAAQVVIQESTIADDDLAGVAVRGHGKAVITASNIVAEEIGLFGQEEAEFSVTGTEFSGNDKGLSLIGSAQAELTDCAFFDNDTGIELEGESSATITTSRFVAGDLALLGKEGAHLVLRESTITGEEHEESFLWITWTARTNGILFAGAEALLEGNTIENCRLGVLLGPRLGLDETPSWEWEGRAILRGNLIRGNQEMGILAESGTLELEGNEIRENALGVGAIREASVILKGNVITANGKHGVVLAGQARAELAGNRFSRNGDCGLYVGPRAEAVLHEGNEFDPDGGNRCGRGPGSLQERIEAAPAGATLTIPPGTHWESLYITKPLTLKAAAAGATLIGGGLEPTIALRLADPGEVRLIGLTLKSGAPGIAVDFPSEAEGEAGMEEPVVALEGCTITANSGGLTAEGGGRLTIAGCSFTEDGERGLDLWNDEVTITETTVSGNEGTGIYISRANATLERLKVEGNETGIVAVTGSHITLAESTITDNQTGLDLKATRSYIHDNLIANNEQIGITVGLRAVILRNEIRGNGIGVEGEGASLDLRYNEISANGLGVRIGGKEAIVGYNTIKANEGDGLRLLRGQVEVRGNVIKDNGGWGIAVWTQACYPESLAPEEFKGEVTGEKNRVYNNAQGDLCGVSESLVS